MIITNARIYLKIASRQTKKDDAQNVKLVILSTKTINVKNYLKIVKKLTKIINAQSANPITTSIKIKSVSPFRLTAKTQIGKVNAHNVNLGMSWIQMGNACLQIVPKLIALENVFNAK